MLLKVLDFIRQQERVGHEAEVNWKETLQTADDHAEDVLLRKVLHGYKKSLTSMSGYLFMKYFFCLIRSISWSRRASPYQNRCPSF